MGFEKLTFKILISFITTMNVARLVIVVVTVQTRVSYHKILLTVYLIIIKN